MVVVGEESDPIGKIPFGPKRMPPAPVVVLDSLLVVVVAAAASPAKTVL